MAGVARTPPVDDQLVERLVDACGDDPSWICEQVFDATDGNQTASEFSDWFVGGPLTALVIVLVAWVLTRLFRRWLEGWVNRVRTVTPDARWKELTKFGIEDAEMFKRDDDERDEARAHSIAVALGSVVTVIIWTIAGLLVLGELGINLAPLVAGAGIAGVALGFGAQSLVKDCLAGFFVLIEDQYGIGDVIDLGEAIGMVEEITLRTTVLRGLDGTVWHVPNGEVQRVGNLSMLWSVALVDVDVAYDSDLDQARDLMLGTATEICTSVQWEDKVIAEPEVLGVEALGADGITMRLVVKTRPGEQWALQRTLREAFKVAFDDAGIDIPFPQRTVWMRAADAG